MAATPSEKTFRRVLAVAAFDGWSVAVFAGLCTLASMGSFSWLGLIVGAPLTVAGAVELRGRGRLTRGDPSGVDLLIAAQLVILGMLLGYSGWNLLNYDEAALLARIPARLNDQLHQSGIRIEDLRPMLKPGYYALYLGVIGTSVLFQGGLALYYHSSKAAVVAAIASHKTVPPPLPA